MPDGAVNELLCDLDRSFTARRFAQRSVGVGTGVLRVYERGSGIADAILTGTGLAAWKTRIGPLSLQGRVLVGASPSTPGHAQVIVSQVTGDPISTAVVAATEAALAATRARGVVIDGPGWIRSVDLPESSPVNPRTAHRLALAQRR